jgi:type VI secretion system protein
MLFDRTLRERLRNAGTVREPILHVRTERVIESVLDHLRKMFNVRQGSVLTVPVYGMPDFNDIVFQFPDAILEIQRAIRTSIEQFEPRLRRVRVRHTPDEEDPLNLRFEIRAELVLEDEHTPVWFETSLDTSGRASVRG